MERFDSISGRPSHLLSYESTEYCEKVRDDDPSQAQLLLQGTISSGALLQQVVDPVRGRERLEINKARVAMIDATLHLLQQIVPRYAVDGEGFAGDAAFDAVAAVRQRVVALLFALSTTCARPERSFSSSG